MPSPESISLESQRLDHAQGAEHAEVVHALPVGESPLGLATGSRPSAPERKATGRSYQEAGRSYQEERGDISALGERCAPRGNEST